MNKFNLFFILLLFCLSLVSAIETYPFNSSVNIQRACFNSNNTDGECSVDTTCKLSVFKANNQSQVIISNQNMTNDKPIHNYTINNSVLNTKGLYRYDIVCVDNGLSNSNSFEFEITPTGIPSTDTRIKTIGISIYFMFGIGLILFLTFLFSNFKLPIKLTFLIFSIIFFIASLNTITISLSDEIVNPRLESFFDSFTAISFYFYWFSAGMLIIIWIFTFFNTHFYNKNLRRLKSFDP